MTDQPSTSPPVFTYLDARFPVRCHEHIAVVHRGGASAERGMEFMSEGLLRGHWCCCPAPADLRAGMLARLQERGVDVARHLSDQTLQFPPEAPGAGDLLNWAMEFFAAAEAARAPAVRWLEDGLEAKPAGTTVTKFFELHSRWNYLVKQYPSAVLCQYHIASMEVPHLFSAIAVHRHLLVEGTLVRDNPFYIPAEKFLGMRPEDRQRELRDVFREVGFDLEKLLATLAGYGQLQQPGPPEA